jgi:chemotaxis protein CheD
MKSFEKLFLYPGQLVVTRDAMEITTLLGSCVSVCLFDSIRKIAGMNHFLLPVNEKNNSDLEKYGDSSLTLMLEKILSMGSKKNDLEAKVFGGGEILIYENLNFNIGKKNITLALDFIKDHEIRLATKVVGGMLGARIIFNTVTGNVTHKYLTSSELPPGNN